MKLSNNNTATSFLGNNNSTVLDNPINITANESLHKRFQSQSLLRETRSNSLRPSSRPILKKSACEEICKLIKDEYGLLIKVARDFLWESKYQHQKVNSPA